MSFHNPYHFIPVKKSERPDDLSVADFKAGRTNQVTHDRFIQNGFSGRILCRLTTEDSIFIGDRRLSSDVENVPAKATPFELEEGRPAVPASTLRGLISSIAEAASLSAMRVLEDELYTYRKAMGKSLSAVGMIFIRPGQDGQPTYLLRPLTLPTIEFERDKPIRVPLNFKKIFSEPHLKVYIGDRDSIRRAGFPYRTYQATTPRFYGLKLKQRSWNADGTLSTDNFQYIKGGAVKKFLLSQLAEDRGQPQDRARPVEWESIPESERSAYTRGVIRVLGCWGREDIPNTKKHELFIPYPEEAEEWPLFEIKAEAVESFHQLADQRTNAKPDGQVYPYEPRDTARNLKPETADDHRFRLKEGDLVFFRPDGMGVSIEEISLSSIWRGRVETKPGPPKAATTYAFFRSIDKEFLPFNSEREKITPAEQLFGFVEHGKEEGVKAGLALAGRLYFSHALLQGIRKTDDSDWISEDKGLGEPYEPSVTLRILDSPKPPAPAMYFKSAKGKAAYIPKDNLNPQFHQPQGRKFYLHRSERDSVNGRPPWKTANATDGWKQKVTVTPIKSHAVFYFHIDFDNLSEREVGLLLYALQPTQNFRHKLGMGKSIGLGRVKIEPVGVFQIDRTKRYMQDGLFSPRYSEVWSSSDREQWPEMYAREKEAQGETFDYQKAYKSFFEKIDQDVHHALELLGTPSNIRARVHTPLVEGGEPEDETFRWFVENDKGSHKFLEPLSAETTLLPVLPAHPRTDEH